MIRERAGLGIVYALLAATAYGFLPPAVRLAYENGVPAIESTVVRTFAIAFAFAVMLAVRGRPLRVVPAARWPLAGMTVSTCLVSVCYLVSVQFIPVGLAVIIFYTYPVLILITAPLIERSAVGLGPLLVVLIAFAGLGIAIGPSFTELDPVGIGLAATAAVAGATQFFCGRKLAPHMAAPEFGFIAHVAFLPAVIALAVWLGGGELQVFPGGTATGFGYAVVLAMGAVYVAGYFIHMRSLALAPASTVAPFFNLEPVISVVIAAVVLGQMLSLNQYVGGAIVLAALLATATIGGSTARRALLRRLGGGAPERAA